MIWGRLSDGAYWTAVCNCLLDLGSETELRIEVKEHLFDDGYVSKVMDDKTSWFTQIEVQDPICHRLFFTANCLGRQLTTSQFFQPLAPLTLALVATTIQVALSKHTNGKKVMPTFSQEEYRRKFCSSIVIDCITAEATALINQTLVGSFIPPPPHTLCSSALLGTPQSPSALHRLVSHFNMSFGAPCPLLCQHSSSKIVTSQSSPQPWLEVPLFHSRLFTPCPLQCCSAWMAAPLDWHSSLRICAPLPRFALLKYILHSSMTICTPLVHPVRPHQALLHSWSHTTFPPNSSYCHSSSIFIHR